jgi:hypothetical protein
VVRRTTEARKRFAAVVIATKIIHVDWTWQPFGLVAVASKGRHIHWAWDRFGAIVVATPFSNTVGNADTMHEIMQTVLRFGSRGHPEARADRNSYENLTQHARSPFEQLDAITHSLTPSTACTAGRLDGSVPTDW